jgi:hypothetical protein
MSLTVKTEKSLYRNDNLTYREKYFYKNKNHLNPIKINKFYDKNDFNNKTFNLNNTIAQFKKTNESLINNNMLLNYLKNLKKQNIYHQFNDLSSKSRNKNIFKGDNIYISKSTNTNNNYVPDSSPRDYHKYYINKNYVKLHSLFNLPTIDTKIHRYNYNNTIHATSKIIDREQNITEIDRSNQKSHSLCSKEIKLIKERPKLESKSRKTKKDERKENNRTDRHNNIYSFMKFKYYEDVNEKMEKKLKDESFIDKGVKEKIIKNKNKKSNRKKS